MIRFFAKSISQVFSPIIVWPLLLCLLLFGTGLTADEQRVVLVPLVLCEIVLPLVLLAIFRKHGWIADVEMTNVRERRYFFIIILGFHALAVVVLWRLTHHDLAWQIRLLAWVIECIGTVITWFWKISVHLATNSFVIAVVLLLGGWQWWPVLLALPLIAWSRIVLHKHTLLQTVAGTGLTFIVTVAGFRLFHWL